MPLYEQPDPTTCDYSGKTLQDVLDILKNDDSDTPYYCREFTPSKNLYPELLNTLAYLSNFLQCFLCNTDEYDNINTRQSFRYWSQYGIYVTDCIPVLQTGKTKDECGVIHSHT